MLSPVSPSVTVKPEFTPQITGEYVDKKHYWIVERVPYFKPERGMTSRWMQGV